MSNRTSNVIKNSSASLIQKLVHIIVQFVLRTVFIFILGKEYTGISGLFTDMLQVLSLMELGLDGSMIYSLYVPLAQKDCHKVSALLKFYKTAFNITGIVVLGLGIACTPFLSVIVKGVPNISEDIRLIFMMYVITSAFSYFLIYKSVLLKADQKSNIVSLWDSITTIVECIIEIILLVFFKKFFIYLIVHFIATVGRNIIISEISNRKYPEYFSTTDAQLTKTEKIELYKYLAYITVYNISGVAINSTDSMFISAFVGTAEIAIIGNFTLIVGSVRTGINRIFNAAKASVGNLAATSTYEKQMQIFKRMNFMSFWLSCFCCTCLFTLLNPFIGNIWFDPSYKVDITIVAVLVVNFYIAVMVYPVEAFRAANGLFVEGWPRPAIMAVLNILLDFLLGKSWGITGILVATTISRLATQVWYDPWLVYRRVFNRSVFPYFFQYSYYAVSTFFCCLISFFICNLITLNLTYIDFLLRMFISVAIPNLMMVVFFRKSDEFNYVLGIMYMLRNKVLRKYY